MRSPSAFSHRIIPCASRRQTHTFAVYPQTRPSLPIRLGVHWSSLPSTLADPAHAIVFTSWSRVPDVGRPNDGRRMSTNSSTSLPNLPIFEAIASHDPWSTAVVHSVSGRTFKYGQLLADVRRVRDQLGRASDRSLDGERIAFLVENSYDYVVTLLACLAARAIAVPLSPAFPAPELTYILNQSEAMLLVSSVKFQSKAQQVLQTELTSRPVHVELAKHTESTETYAPVTLEGDPGAAAMMLYTSGTTNRPKGVLLPQSVLTAQAQSLHKAWAYSPSDRLLHVLPLHHIHGTVNAVLTPLFAGSSVEFLFPFNADAVWKRLAAPFLPTAVTNDSITNGSVATPVRKDPITFFTVVPTVYSRLLASHKSLPPDLQEATRTAISPAHMRLSISGSAALPTPIKSAWTKLSHGNVLLERYGMTEVGMALSCGLAFSDRVDASVGWPLPSVEARLVESETGQVIQLGEEVDPQGRERSGEIQLRGPTIFREYWKNPEATTSEFVEGGDGKGKWFKTGDVAVRRNVPSSGSTPPSSSQQAPPNSATYEALQTWTHGPMYFIQGRKSSDIIKSGGEKVSALEVERELLSLPQISEAAVVAVPSGTWGQKVGAILILNQDHFAAAATPAKQPESSSSSNSNGQVVDEAVSKAKLWSPMDMRRALKGRLANYKIPQVMRVVDDIPKNAMGKINKKELVKAIFADEFSEDEA